MKVRELIELLRMYPGDMEVLITDGFYGVFYRGEYEVKEFDGCVDIGVGGCREDDSDD